MAIIIDLSRHHDQTGTISVYSDDCEMFFEVCQNRGATTDTEEHIEFKMDKAGASLLAAAIQIGTENLKGH